MSLKRARRRRSENGAALIIVLALLVLVLGLVITFLARSRVERSASASYAAASSTRQLADTVVSFVEGQIRDATSQGGAVNWTSQPGMVRTFDTAGNLLRAYKLYSADALIVTIVGAKIDEPPANWGQQPAIWTDLNAPISIDGSLSYPVLDPRAEGMVGGFSLSDPPAGGGSNPAPMPVKWLYILQDGQLVAPSGGSDIATIAEANLQNPIVGRIAFWTDDDSCKININTACGDELNAPVGSFWDTPRVVTANERSNLSDRIPAKNEFQRFPGHPATVYLSEVFPNLTRANLGVIVPRVEAGGTEGGTQTSSQEVVLDKDRLYATVDELMLRPDRTNNSGLTHDDVERATFFLTTNSRSPEVNLFDEPRVAIWPIDSRGEAYRTAYDNLVKFCATIGGAPYYFRRSDSSGKTTDASANTDLFNYLDSLTQRQVPGFGGSFSTKYATDVRQQLLVELLDYIRCTNLNDAQLQPQYRYTSEASGLGQVVPMTMAGHQGFGRFYTLSEAALVVTNEAQQGQPQKTNGAAVPTGTDEKVIQAGLALQPFSVMQGAYILFMRSTFEVSGLKSLKVRDNNGNMADLFATDTATSTVSGVNGGSFLYGGRGVGGNSDFRHLLFNNGDQFLGQRLTVKGSNLEFSGGTITVKIYGSDVPSSENLVQTFSFAFPPSSGSGFPMPIFNQALHPMNSRWKGPSVIGGSSSTHNNMNTAEYTLVSSNDLVRSVRIDDGDVRQVALMPVVPAAKFVKHADYDTTKLSAHGLVYGGNYRVFDRSYAKLVGVTGNYNINYAPAYPKGLASLTTGDFDNGVGQNMDGAYINKPDEGSVTSDGTNYFSSGGIDPVPSSLFSPNRIVSSPGIFGSLPTGKAWETLLFRPQTGHPNASATTPDHLVMDLFWMPIVQPYAISEPLSTAGKINLNCRIMPFSYINRSTGLAAAFKGEQYLAIPDSQVANYKPGGVQQTDFRKPVNGDHLISQITARLDSDVFRSPSEICDLDLDTIDWSSHRLTGDNSRERPYANLYQKLTTRSNTFTIHCRVQALKKSPATGAAVWDESRDKVVGEYRGSTTIERYINPNTASIPDYLAHPSSTPTLGQFYKWRTLNTHQFAP